MMTPEESVILLHLIIAQNNGRQVGKRGRKKGSINGECVGG